MAGEALKKEPSQSLPYIGSKVMIQIKDQWIKDNIVQRITEALNSSVTTEYI